MTASPEPDADALSLTDEELRAEYRRLRARVETLERERARLKGLDEKLRLVTVASQDRFENSPIPMTFEDWSEVRRLVDGLAEAGITDIVQYVKDHPDYLALLGPAAKILDANPAAVRIYKTTHKAELLRELNRAPDLETYNPTTGLSDIFVNLVDRFSRGETRIELEGPDTALDGSVIQIRTTTSIAKGHERDWGAVLQTVEDITRRKAAEDGQRELRERYELALKGANDGIWDWDLGTGQIHHSPRLAEIIGLSGSTDVLSAEQVLTFAHPDDLSQFETTLRAHIKGDSASFSCEFRLRPVDNLETWVLIRGVALRDSRGRAHRMAGSLSDITVRKRAENEVRRLAMTDALTGLSNLKQFQLKLDEAIARARRHRLRIALLLLDLDRFKPVNDTFGHPTGDAVLEVVADKLRDLCRESDVVARIGGDEFAVVLTRTDDVTTTRTPAQRMIDSLSSPFNVLEQELRIGVSIGIAHFPDDAIDAIGLRHAADRALYKAKKAGRNRFRFFSDPPD